MQKNVNALRLDSMKRFKIKDMITIIYLRNMLRKKKSPIILICGRRRMGKTMLALRLAEEIQPDFDIKNQMFFEVSKFAHAINKYENKVLIMDEGGIELDPMRAFETKQIVYSHIVQSQGYKNNLIFLVLPVAIDFGKRHRYHVDAVIEVKGHGSFTLYRCNKWLANLNYSKITQERIESIKGVPLPSHHIKEYYLKVIEKDMKKTILEKEISKLLPKQHLQAQSHDTLKPETLTLTEFGKSLLTVDNVNDK